MSQTSKNSASALAEGDEAAAAPAPTKRRRSSSKPKPAQAAPVQEVAADAAPAVPPKPRRKRPTQSVEAAQAVETAPEPHAEAQPAEAAKAPARRRRKSADPATAAEPNPDSAAPQDAAPAPAAPSARQKRRARSEATQAVLAALAGEAAAMVAAAQAAQAEALAKAQAQTDGAPEPSPLAAPSNDQAEAAAPREALPLPEAPRFERLLSEEDQSLSLPERVFTSHRLRALGAAAAGVVTVQLMGQHAWRCDCADFQAQGQCEHGAALLALLSPDEQTTLDEGWPGAAAELWLRPGPVRQLQWVAGRDLPEALQAQAQAALDEAQRCDAEWAFPWLQELLQTAHALGVLVRVEPAVWAQLAWSRDTAARAAKLEQALEQDPQWQAPLHGLQDAVPVYQWEAAQFAVAAGRALLADDLGLGQRPAALAAATLWTRLFGLEGIWIVAPAAAHAAWQRDMQRWWGDQAPTHQLLSELPAAGTAEAPMLLIVDSPELFAPAQREALRQLEVPHLMLLAAQDPLGKPELADWVQWLDHAKRGPWARLQALEANAGKRAQREALETVLLTRPRRELVAQLPAQITQQRWLKLPAKHVEMPAAALAQLRLLAARWQQSGWLDSAQQRQLLDALSLLPPSSRQVLAAKAQALAELHGECFNSPVPMAARLLVCARSETLLDSLAAAAALRACAPLRLAPGASAAQLEELLQLWRAQPKRPLLLSDAALQRHAQAVRAVGVGAMGAALALVHADQPWSAAQLEQRAEAAAGAQRGLPVLRILVADSLDERLHDGALAMPQWLDEPTPWLDEAQLATLMPALAPLLA
ncbi:hypothetical protein ACG0Z6_16205 [Roseateles sp. BYS180W]|uniref:SWIM-type domain-containing protein n=1 Tax=Roseateles rivi TaxID=3299028 RepID=A0ABW7FZM1_9BURK